VADAPVNTLGYLRVMFAVDDLDDTVARLTARGARLVDRVVQYEDMYRLCYVRGPEGVLVGLAEQLGGAGQPRKDEAVRGCGRSRAALRPARFLALLGMIDL
jgi:hypothetical protein